MALKIDLEADANFTKAALTDVYLRIDRVQVFPKYDVIKVYVEGYVKTESREAVRAIEVQQYDYFQKMFSDTGKEILNGSLFNQLLEERNQYETPPFMRDYPVNIFNDSYTVKLTDELKNLDIDNLYTKLYKLIATDSRFSNVRNDI